MLYFCGAARQQRVSTNFFYELEIPLPPVEKQVEIAKQIANFNERAKSLQQEAHEILENVKKKVELMILGE